MVGLRRRLAFGFVDEFFHPRQFALLGGCQKNHLIRGIRGKDLGNGAKLGGEVRVDEEESHKSVRGRVGLSADDIC